MAAPEVESFDHLFTFPRGDIDITATYKGMKIKGKVSGQALSMASPVWHKFVSPPWKTVDSPPITEINFSDDDGSSLLILLRIAHLKLFHIPKTVDLMTAYNIALMCEQYDCVHLLSPWIEKWLKALNRIKTHRSVHAAQERRAYVYWAFGDVAGFRSAAMSMVKNSGTSSAGHKELTLSREILPNKLYENIQAIRDSTMLKLLELPYTEVDKYFKSYTSAQEKPVLCLLSNRRCDVLVYGSLTLDLGCIGLWPPKPVREIQSSLKSIRTSLKDFKVMGYYPDINERGDHEDCRGPNYDEGIDRIMNNIEDPTEECHIRHMELRKGATVSGNNSPRTYPQCVRCNTSHSTAQDCPPNPRKRAAE